MFARPRSFAPLAALPLFALLACSKGDHSPSSSGSTSASQTTASPDAATSQAACEPVTCESFAKSPGFTAGRVVDLPTIPPPPPGASVCGGSMAYGATGFYSTSMSPADVISYYEKGLVGRGFTLKPHASGARACSMMLRFHESKQLQSGTVVAFTGGFSVMFGEK